MSGSGLSGGLCLAADELGYKNSFRYRKNPFQLFWQVKILLWRLRQVPEKLRLFCFRFCSVCLKKKLENHHQCGFLYSFRQGELALQVAEAAKVFCRYIPEKIKITAVHGGVSINPQLKSLSTGTDILVATPGRLIDVVNNNAARLSNVETLVIDEADRMLDLGFKDELAVILEKCFLPKDRISFFQQRLAAKLKFQAWIF